MKRFFFRQLSLVLVIALLLSLTGVAENDGSMHTNDDDAQTANEIAIEDADFDVVAAEDVVPEELGDIDLLVDILLEDGDISAPGEPVESMESPDPAETLAPDEEETTEPSEATGAKNEKAVPKELTLGKGETYDFGIKNATITTNKKSVVSVDKKKKTIKAEGTGSAKITVKTGKKTYTCKVTVLKAPGSVTLSKTKLTLPATDTYQLKVSFPSKTASNKLTWKSSNTKVATVDENGVVTGVKKGTAKITVTTFNKKSATCKVTVNNDPAYVSFPMESITIGKGESVTIKPEVNKGAKPKYTWKSKKKTIATVDKNGKITGKKAGSSTTITVETQNGKKATLKVDVKAAPGSVALSDATVEVGSTVQLKAKLKSKTASYNLTWKSSDKKIAKVDKSGVVTGVKEGTAKITVTTFNKQKATCTVTVNAPIPVVGTITSLTLKFGDVLAGDETVVIPNEDVTAFWAAEGDVESYYYQLLDAAGTIVASQDAVATTSYEIAAGAINTGEVYTLRVGAMPTNGIENDIVWKTATFKRNASEEKTTTIDETNFPDDNLRQAVQAFDTDGDGKLSEAESASVQGLNLNSVSSLAGIEVFTNLKNLTCENSGLTQADVSKNTALEGLDLSGNNLSNLDITKNTGLKILDISNNNLTTLDLSQNTALTSINVSGNQLTSLDISKNPSLVTCVANGSRTEENGVVIYSDGNATLVVNSGVVIITDLPVVATITSLKIFFDGLEAVEGENVIADTAVTASWVAEGDVASYSYAITKANGDTFISGNGADATSYVIAADALTAGEVYTLTVKAIPTNGTENEATITAAKFKRDIKPTEYFSYNVKDSKYAIVTGFSGTFPDMVVPEKLGGYPVQRIAANAFSGNKFIEHVYLPDGLKEIGNESFRNCDNLVSIVLPDSIEKFGYWAFSECDKLEAINYPTSLQSIEYGYPVFNGCVSLKQIVVPEGVTTLPGHVFESSSLSHITLPETLKDIGYASFGNCESLLKVYLGVNVTSIDNSSFDNCPNLTIWTEYGATALQYAKDNNIPYYYLSMNGATYPAGTHYKGDTFDFYGYVRSNYGVSTLTASIYSAKEQRNVFSVNLTPGMEECNLSELINSSLLIGQLELGEYTYTISASTTLDTETFVVSRFTVVPQPVRTYDGGIVAPSGYLSLGDSFTLAGSIESNYTISNASVEIINTANTTVSSYAEAPNSNIFYISNANGALGFASLSEGEYTFRILITANSEASIAYESRFTVLSVDTQTALATDFDAVFKMTSMAEYGVLRKDSMMMSEAAYDKDAAKRCLGTLGFKDITTYRYNSETDTCGHVLGWKDINNNGSTIRVFAVICRGTHSGVEWQSNFRVINSGTYHYGFYTAANDVRGNVETYVANHSGDRSISDCKVWVTGHSRGAAVANIVAGLFMPQIGFQQKNIYAYTFACPNVSMDKLPANKNIYNYNIGGDLVPCVPLSQWGYSRYGIDRIAHNGDYLEGISVIDEQTMKEFSATLGSISSADQVAFMQAVQQSLADQGVTGTTTNRIFVVTALYKAMIAQSARFITDPIRWASGIGNISEIVKDIYNTHNPNTYWWWVYSMN